MGNLWFCYQKLICIQDIFFAVLICVDCFANLQPEEQWFWYVEYLYVPIGLTQNQFQIQASGALSTRELFWLDFSCLQIQALRTVASILGCSAQSSGAICSSCCTSSLNGATFSALKRRHLEIQRWIIAMVAVVAMDGSWQNRHRWGSEKGSWEGDGRRDNKIGT